MRDRLCSTRVEAESVVDEELRDRDSNGLRVVDASVMSHPASSDANFPTIMIGERLADPIRRNPGWGSGVKTNRLRTGETAARSDGENRYIRARRYQVETEMARWEDLPEYEREYLEGRTRKRLLETARMNPDAELRLNQRHQPARPDTAVPGPVLVNEAQHLWSDLVRPAWSARLGNQPVQSALVERSGHAEAGRTRHPEALRGLGEGGLAQTHQAHHLVADLKQVPRIEEVVGSE